VPACDLPGAARPGVQAQSAVRDVPADTVCRSGVAVSRHARQRHQDQTDQTGDHQHEKDGHRGALPAFRTEMFRSRCRRAM
jgi:hypothetical protein